VQQSRLDGFVARENLGHDWVVIQKTEGEDGGSTDFMASTDRAGMGSGSFRTVHTDLTIWGGAKMIRVNLDVMMARRKMRLNDLADAVGISIQNLSVVKTGKARAVRFTTLDALCRILQCQPGDILEFDGSLARQDQPYDGAAGQ
jgi:putative transcriptional regulator